MAQATNRTDPTSIDSAAARHAREAPSPELGAAPLTGCVPAPPTGPTSALPRVRSSELLGRSDRLLIEHEGHEYVLLLTRNGKLLLNRASSR